MADIAEQVLVKVDGDSSGAQKAINQVNSKTDELSSKSVASGMLQAQALITAGKAVIDFGKSSVAAYQKAQDSITIFQTTAKNVGWSQAQMDAAQKGSGLISAGMMRTAAAAAATKGVSGDAFAAISTGLQDWSVAQKGVSVTADDMAAQMDLFSKAIVGGNVGAAARAVPALKSIDAATFQNMTQAERAAAINSALEKSVGGVNTALAGTPSGALKQLNTAYKGLQVAVGGFLSGQKSFSDVLGSLKNFIKPIQILFDNFKNANPVITSVAVGIGAIVAALTVWKTVTTVATAVQTVFNAVQAANPMMLVALAVLAVVSALTFFLTQTKTGQKVLSALGSFFKKVWDDIKTVIQAVANFFGAVWNVAKTVFTAVWSALSAYVQAVVAVWSTIFNTVVTVWTAVWNTAKTVFTTIWNAISAYIQTVVTVWTTIFNTAVTVWTAVWNTAKTVFTAVWDAISAYIQTLVAVWSTIFNSLSTAVSAVWNGIKNTAKTVFDWITGAVNTVASVFQTAFNRIGSTFSAIWDGVKKGFSDLFSNIKGLFNGVIKGINGAIHLINHIPGVNVGDIPLLASGGLVGGTGGNRTDSNLAMLSRGEYVLNASAVRGLGVKTLDALNSGQMPGVPVSGSTQNITVNAPQNADPLALSQLIGMQTRWAVAR